MATPMMAKMYDPKTKGLVEVDIRAQCEAEAKKNQQALAYAQQQLALPYGQRSSPNFTDGILHKMVALFTAVGDLDAVYQRRLGLSDAQLTRDGIAFEQYLQMPDNLPSETYIEARYGTQGGVE